MVSVFSLKSGEPVSSICSASANALGSSMEWMGSGNSGISSMFYSKLLGVF